MRLQRDRGLPRLAPTCGPSSRPPSFLTSFLPRRQQSFQKQQLEERGGDLPVKGEGSGERGRDSQGREPSSRVRRLVPSSDVTPLCLGHGARTAQCPSDVQDGARRGLSAHGWSPLLLLLCLSPF